jgi:hypothetical protein
MAIDVPTDTDHLAGFGYKQELDRSLGKFSSFAAGFSYLSILTGVFQLFGFGFSFGGPRSGGPGRSSAWCSSSARRTTSPRTTAATRRCWKSIGPRPR